MKRIRVEGGRAPAPKRILADLDSDDEVIVKMKAEKFTDKQIAARLREEGRVNYHYKTISSRWVRIKRALEKKQDQDLDDQLTDWHEGDVGQNPLSPRKYADFSRTMFCSKPLLLLTEKYIASSKQLRRGNGDWSRCR